MGNANCRPACDGATLNVLRTRICADMIQRVLNRLHHERLQRRLSPAARQVQRQRLTYLEPVKLLQIEDAIRDAQRERVPGDFVECGVALGGSAVLLARGASAQERCFDGYDVFGMIPPPTEKDHRRSMSAIGRSFRESHRGLTAMNITVTGPTYTITSPESSISLALLSARVSDCTRACSMTRCTLRRPWRLLTSIATGTSRSSCVSTGSIRTSRSVAG